jgi:hypothetical protein
VDTVPSATAGCRAVGCDGSGYQPDDVLDESVDTRGAVVEAQHEPVRAVLVEPELEFIGDLLEAAGEAVVGMTLQVLDDQLMQRKPLARQPAVQLGATAPPPWTMSTNSAARW